MLKRDLPIIVSSVAGLVVILDFFYKNALLQRWSTTLQNWGVLVSAFALGVASVNLARVHVKKVHKRDKGWFTSVILLTTLVLVTVTGIKNGANSKAYMYWFDNVYSASHSAISGLLAFFIATASFRAFRARSLEASLMLGASFIVLLGLAPVGELIWKGLPGLQQWVINVPNMAGQRGIIITAGIGAIAASLRVLLGLERGQLTGSGS